MRRFTAARALTTVSLGLLLASCAGDKKPDTPARAGPPAAAELAVAPVAIKTVDVGADGDAKALTLAFAAAVAHTGGVATVDEPSVRETMTAGCDAPPCTTDETQAYANAGVVATASVAKAGEVWLANGRVLEGARVLARATASAKDAVAAVEEIGWELGARVHDELKARAPAPPPAGDASDVADAAEEESDK